MVAPAPTTITPIEEFRRSVNTDAMRQEFKSALPDHISIDKFLRVLVTAAQMNPELLAADRQSLYSAAMFAAQDGLMPDGKEAVINIYNTNVGTKDAPKWVKKCKYGAMIYGILKKVRNSGELSSIHADVVYEKDKFDHFVDQDGPHLIHRPSLGEDRGKPVQTYAVAKTKDGGVYIEVMSEKQVDDVRKVSKSKDSGPWAGDFKDEMRKKSVLRRLSKRLPMSTDIETLMHRDDDDHDFDQPQAPAPTTAAPVTEPKPEAPKGSPAKLLDAMTPAPGAEEPPL